LLAGLPTEKAAMPLTMRWNRKYALMSYIRGSLWITPFFALLLYWVVSHIADAVGAWLMATGRIDETTSFYGLSLTGAQSMLENVVTANLSFLVFTFGSLLVAIQVAGGQYTPRIIATTLLRDNTIRCPAAVGLFAVYGDPMTGQLRCFSALTRCHG
jgi:uncharacterized membrane protein